MNFSAWTLNHSRQVGDFVRSGARSAIIDLEPSAANCRECDEANLSAQPVRLRLVRVTLKGGGTGVFATSSLDEEQWPNALFRELYARRWPIEEHYKREKLRLEIENFSGKSPWIVDQEIYAKVLAANLTAMMEWVTQALADERYQHRESQYQVNFAELLSVMKNRIVRLLSLPDISGLLLAIMEHAVKAVEQCGRNRSFPRKPRRDGCRFAPNYKRTA